MKIPGLFLWRQPVLPVWLQSLCGRLHSSVALVSKDFNILRQLPSDTVSSATPHSPPHSLKYDSPIYPNNFSLASFGSLLHIRPHSDLHSKVTGSPSQCFLSLDPVLFLPCYNKSHMCCLVQLEQKGLRELGFLQHFQGHRRGDGERAE